MTVIKHHYGFGKGVDFALESSVQLLPVFPVDAALYLHIAGSGIVEIPGKVLANSLLLDGLKGLGLILRLVGIYGLVVRFPQAYKGMPVGVFGLGE